MSDGTNLDITQDLTGDANDGALGDRPQYAQSGDAQMQAPAGTQHVHGDAQHVSADVKDAAKTPEPSLREQLSNAFKGTDGKPTDQENAQSANADKPAVQSPTLTQDAEGKYRLADGTFASAEQVQAFQAAQNAPAEQQQQQAQSGILNTLTATEAQQFQSLPAELRQYVERTMEGLNTRAARYSEYDQLEQLIGPRREAYAQQGTNPVVAINQLYALSDFAGRDPGNFVMWFSQQNNLDLDALLDARDAQNANVDPRVQQLEGQVQQLQGTVQQFQQQGQQSAQQANLDTVQQFATAKDASGALSRPYLTEVMDGWSAQIGVLRAANPTMPNEQLLQKAYDNACWTDPAVREKMQQATTSAAKAEQASRVAAAKAAGSSVTGAPNSSNTSRDNSSRTIREELQAQFAAAEAF